MGRNDPRLRRAGGVGQMRVPTGQGRAENLLGEDDDNFQGIGGAGGAFQQPVFEPPSEEAITSLMVTFST